MKEVLLNLWDLLEKGRGAVLATIVQQSGSSPRGVGTKCLVTEDGSLIGTIGGGLLEAQTTAKAGEVFEAALPATLLFTLKGTDVAETDMLCGGNVDVFLEPVSAQDSESLSVFRRAAALIRRGGRGLLITILDPQQWQEGKAPRMFLDRDGGKAGSIEGEDWIEAAFEGKLPELLAAGKPRVMSFDREGREVRLLVEALVSEPVLYVFGGGHVSQQIVPLAHKVGFDVVVIDDRPEFTDPARFPEAHKTLAAPLEGVMGQLPVDESSYLVIVTRGHVHDKTVLAQALKSTACYVGMIGSRRKRDIIYAHLLQEGFNQDDITRVHSPIGLDIGADTPEEIAVSIVAELIKVRAGQQGRKSNQIPNILPQTATPA